MRDNGLLKIIENGYFYLISEEVLDKCGLFSLLECGYAILLNYFTFEVNLRLCGAIKNYYLRGVKLVIIVFSCNGIMEKLQIIR